MRPLIILTTAPKSMYECPINRHNAEGCVDWKCCEFVDGKEVNFDFSKCPYCTTLNRVMRRGLTTIVEA